MPNDEGDKKSMSTIFMYRALVLERLGIQLRMRTGKNMSFQNGHPIYRVLVLIGLGIQLRTGKNMSNQNKQTIFLFKIQSISAIISSDIVSNRI